MNAKWICRTCNERIEKPDIEVHEADGHDVAGFLRPDRLLSNDPWTVGERRGTPESGNGAVSDGDGNGEVRD